MRKFRFSIVFIILVSMIMSPIAWANDAEIPEKYDLRDYFDLAVKNQHAYGICINEAQSTAIESYIKLKKHNGELDYFTENPVISALAMEKNLAPISHVIPVEYVDAIIKEYYNGEINSEQEAIRENKAEGEELIRELEKIQSKYMIYNQYGSAGKFVYLDDIEKKVNEDGISYFDNGFEIELSNQEVQRRRDDIKRTIMTHGAVVADCYGSQICWTTSPEDGKTINVLNMKDDYTTDHGVALIGWDDNFSRMNFPEDIRPFNDGAYIAQNSWGDEWGRNGIFYISYEDVNVEDGLSYVYDIDLYEDTDAPIIISKKTDDVWSITVSDNYGSGIKRQQYIWTEHNREPSLSDDGWVEFEYNAFVPNIQGKYIWVYAEDNKGNATFKSLKYDTNDIRWVAKDSGKNTIYVKGAEKDEIYIYCDTLTQNLLWQNHRRDSSGVSTFPLYTPGNHKIYVSKYVEVDGEIIETRAKMIELNIKNPWGDDEETPNNNEIPGINDEIPENNNEVDNETQNNDNENSTGTNAENDTNNNNHEIDNNDIFVDDNNNDQNTDNNSKHNTTGDNNKKDNVTVIDIKEPEVVIMDKDNKKADVKPNSIVVKNENLIEVDKPIPQTGENHVMAICIAGGIIVLSAGAITFKIKRTKNNKEK